VNPRWLRDDDRQFIAALVLAAAALIAAGVLHAMHVPV